MSDENKTDKAMDRRAFVATIALGTVATGAAVPPKAATESISDGGQPGAIWWIEYLANDAKTRRKDLQDFAPRQNFVLA